MKKFWRGVRGAIICVLMGVITWYSLDLAAHIAQWFYSKDISYFVVMVATVAGIGFWFGYDD